MIKANSSIKLNMAAIKNLSDSAERALELTAEHIHTETVQDRVVPRKDGTLQGDAFFVDTSKSMVGQVTLVHNTPYARRLYFHPEYEFHKGPWEETIKHRDGTVSHLKHDGNPNAKGKWFDDWLPGGKRQDEATDVYKKIYKRLAGI